MLINCEEMRRHDFRRNQDLELLLKQINNDLWKVEQELIPKLEPSFPLIFIVGALRSGSTLMMQWLANTNYFAYPTNLLSRFFNAPIIGSKIQLLLTDERFNFRNELFEFKSPVEYRSENGKTKGVLAPNEFWYFWRRFLPFGELDYLSTDDLLKKSDVGTLVGELSGIIDVFNKPFVMKANILNYNIDFLDKLFDKCIFLYTKREPLANIESALKARERQMGSIDAWYSFKIPEYPKLKMFNPYEQVAGQIYSINKAVESGLSGVAEHKKFTVGYEEFCKNPVHFYYQLKEKLVANGCEINAKYPLSDKFRITRTKVQNGDILKAYKKFYD